MAAASQTRHGRMVHTVVNFSYDGPVQHDRALWRVDVRCGTRASGTGEVSAVTGTAMLAQQGSWGGDAPPIGEVCVIEAENDP